MNNKILRNWLKPAPNKLYRNNGQGKNLGDGIYNNVGDIQDFGDKILMLL